MVVLLICLVLVVVAIVVVIRLLLAELARSAAYRQVTPRDHALDYGSVKPADAKVPVSAVRAAERAGVGRGPDRLPLAPGVPDGSDVYQDGSLLLEVPPRPRPREVGRVTKVVWWRRLRSGTALVLLVALLGVATAAVIGAIVLFFAFVLEQAIN